MFQILKKILLTQKLRSWKLLWPEEAGGNGAGSKGEDATFQPAVELSGARFYPHQTVNKP